MAFGRPGCGAPQRTKSGRIRTAIFGNPEIRFQANESVKKTINNNIRFGFKLDFTDLTTLKYQGTQRTGASRRSTASSWKIRSGRGRRTRTRRGT